MQWRRRHSLITFVVMNTGRDARRNRSLAVPFTPEILYKDRRTSPPKAFVFF